MMTTAIAEAAPTRMSPAQVRPTVWTPFNAHAEGQRLFKQWYASLEHANERKEPVANVFVMGNAIEILRSFDFHMVFPEINSLQTGVRKTSAEFIRMSEDYGMSPDVCSYVKADMGMMLPAGWKISSRISSRSARRSPVSALTSIAWRKSRDE
ncbi:MAG: 2-hydroxyacyl-CoA dehydratase family protein [Proteobacteria bacterium]|nr:2-hydroxyacyl-CoA dehydratase family protein [Pseudomonadota bacterium]